MQTKLSCEFGDLEFLKGAPEKVIELCNLTKEEKSNILQDMSLEQKLGRRCLAFAYKFLTEEKYTYQLKF